MPAPELTPLQKEAYACLQSCAAFIGDTRAELALSLSELARELGEPKRLGAGFELERRQQPLRFVVSGEIWSQLGLATGPSRYFGSGSILGLGALAAWARGFPQLSFVPQATVTEEALVYEVQPRDFKRLFKSKAGERTPVLERLLQMHRVNQDAQEIATALGWEQRLGNALDPDLYRIVEGASWVDEPSVVLTANQPPETFYVLIQAKCELERDGLTFAELYSPECVGLWQLMRKQPMAGSARLTHLPKKPFRAVRISGAWFNRLRELDPDFDRRIQRASHDWEFPSRPAAQRQVVVLAAARPEDLPSGLSVLLAQAMASHMHEHVLQVSLCAEERQATEPGSQEWTAPETNGWVRQCTRPAGRPLHEDSLYGDVNVTLVDTAGSPDWREALRGVMAQLRVGKNAEAPLEVPIKLLFLGRTPEDWGKVAPLPRGVELVFTALLSSPRPPALGLELFRARGQGANWAEYLGTMASVTPSVVKVAGERFAKQLQERTRRRRQRTWPLKTTRARLPTTWFGGDKGRLPVDFFCDEMTQAARQTLHRIARAATGRKLGVALGGGGAFGYVHLALLHRLREEGIELDVVSGSSFGSVVGAYYCTAGDEGLKLMEQHWPFLVLAAVAGPLSSAGVAWGVNLDLGHQELEQLEICFLPVVTDADMAVESDVRKGTVGDGARASSSLPPGLGPTILGGRRLLDGGLMALVPVNALRFEGADLLISANVVAKVPPRTRRKNRVPVVGRLMSEFSPILRIWDGFRMLDMLGRAAGENQRTTDNAVIYRAKYSKAHLYDFWNARKIVDRAMCSFEVNDTVLKFQSLWRRSLNNPPSRVKKQGTSGLQLTEPLLFMKGMLAESSESLLDELVEYLQKDNTTQGFTVVLTGGGTMAEQRARVVENFLRPKLGKGCKFTVQAEPGHAGAISHLSLRNLMSGDMVLKQRLESRLERLVSAQMDLREELRLAQGDVVARSLVFHATRHCLTGDVELARLLALEAVQTDRSFETERVLREVLLRHGRSVAILDAEAGAFTCLAWNPTHPHLLATATHDALVRVWNLAGPVPEMIGPCLAQTGGTDQAVLDLTWSPDGTRLFSIALNTMIKAWSVSDSGPVSVEPVFQADTGTWNHSGIGLGLSPDGRFVLARNAGGGCTLFDSLAGREQVNVPVTIEGPVSSAAWAPRLQPWTAAPDIGFATSNPQGKEVIVWRVENGRPVEFTRLACEAPGPLAWHPEGEALLVGGRDSARIFLPGGGQTEFGAHKDIIDVSWSANGRWAITLCATGRVRVWHGLGQGVSTGAFHGDTQAEHILGVCWNPLVDDLVATWSFSSILIWHVPSWRCLARLTGHNGRIETVVWGANGRYLASASKDGTVRVWDPVDGGPELSTPVDVHSVKMPLVGAPFSQGKSQESPAAVVEQLEQFLHWKAPEARPEAQPILVSESSPLRFDEAHWEVRVTQAGDTAHVSVWDTEKNVELGSIPKVSRLVRDGSRKRVAICQWASAGLWLFDAGEGGAPRRFGSGEQDGCWDVSWGEEDKWLATGSNDSHAYVYSAVAQPKLLWKIKHKAPVHRVAMHPKYRLLATGDVLGNVSIWELSQSTGELSHSKRPPDNLVASPQGNWSCIHHLLWSPDGSRLFSATAMGRWQLWSRHPSGKWYMQTSMSFTDPLIHPLPLTAVSFSPDSRYVFTVGADNMVRRYPVDLDTLTGCVAALPWRNQLSVVERTRYLQNGAQRWSLPPGPTVSGDESAEFGSSATDLRRAGGWGKRGSAH